MKFRFSFPTASSESKALSSDLCLSDEEGLLPKQSRKRKGTRDVLCPENVKEELTRKRRRKKATVKEEEAEEEAELEEEEEQEEEEEEEEQDQEDEEAVEVRRGRRKRLVKIGQDESGGRRKRARTPDAERMRAVQESLFQFLNQFVSSLYEKQLSKSARMEIRAIQEKQYDDVGASLLRDIRSVTLSFRSLSFSLSLFQISPSQLCVRAALAPTPAKEPFEKSLQEFLSRKKISVSYLTCPLEATSDPKPIVKTSKMSIRSLEKKSPRPNYAIKKDSDSSSDKSDAADSDPNYAFEKVIDQVITHKIQPILSDDPEVCLFRFHELEFEKRTFPLLPLPPLGHHYVYRVKWKNCSFLHLSWTTARQFESESFVGMDCVARLRYFSNTNDSYFVLVSHSHDVLFA
jgi:hypothetical protein